MILHKTTLRLMLCFVLFGLWACEEPPPLQIDDVDQSQDLGADASSDASQDVPQDLPVDSCTFMDRECVDSASYRVCIRTASGTTWSNSSACVSGVCAGPGLCCDRPCVEGDKVCTAAGIQTCVKTTDGCFAYSDPVACPDNKSCTPDGQCTAQCQDACTQNETRCVQDGTPLYKACLKGPSGCFQFESTERTCPAGEVCQQGICKTAPTCQHQCASGEIGQKRCTGQTEESCQADNNGCRAWAATGAQCNINQCPCLTGMTNDGKPIDNVCFYVQSEQQGNCPMVAPGGYCDPNGDGNFSDGDWARGWHEYRGICGL